MVIIEGSNIIYVALFLLEGVKNAESCMWICKPTGLNQGRGIFLLKNQQEVVEFRLKLQSLEDNRAGQRTPYRQTQASIVQRWVNT